MKRVIIALIFSTAAIFAENVISEPVIFSTAPLDTAPAEIALSAPASPTAKDVTNVSRISEAFGHLIGKNLDTLGVQLDVAQIVKGLQDAAAGKDSPMTDMECIQAIASVKESNFKQQAVDNLKRANEFLSANSTKSGVVVLEDGKLQYKIEKEGQGSSVAEHSSPLIRYSGQLIDGTVCEASTETELMSLDETFKGFAKGVVGMKEGEKRTLYIHPDLAYQTSAGLPPNSLVTFEVEVVKADASPAEVQDSLSHTPVSEKLSPEIATPAAAPTAIR
ncbi:MAG: FKBP-type peptidyl-prolyl cis-trans isomerase [Rhabdochlamydiaceae bacterium]|jgi:peptidylprolyl isomerase